MHPAVIHTLFDTLAWGASLACLLVLRRTWFTDRPVGERLRLGYLAALFLGAGLGAWGFGTANLYASANPEIGRSIEGALAGAIVAVEIYKKANGITYRTGAVYALPLALGIAVGRIGCLLSGFYDFTYGIPTGAAWGWDFGDGIPRHPVQIYESIALISFALVYAVMVWRGSFWWKSNGFYLLIGFYGLERFLLEFLKPYGQVFGGLTVFQLLSLGLVAYAAVMIRTGRKVENMST